LSDVSLNQFSEQIADHYFSINYDSWANIYTAVEVVKVHVCSGPSTPGFRSVLCAEFDLEREAAGNGNFPG